MSRTKPAPRAPVGPSRRSWGAPAVMAAVLGFVALLGLVAFLASRDSGSQDGEGADRIETEQVEVSGAPLPGHREGNDGAVGLTIPTLRGVSFDGTARSVTPGGTPQVVVFVAHWCEVCRREVPALVEHFEEQGLPSGVEMMTVSTAVDENRPNYPPSAWLEREGWPVRAMVDDAESSAASAYGLGAFPFFVFADVQGRVVSRHAGYMEVEEFSRRVDQLS